MRALAALGFFALAGAALAQPAPQYQFPSAPGSASPPSTLRITETPQSATAAGLSGVARDTPESLEEYQRCRTVSDRAAVGNDQMRIGVAQCLRELEARRQAAPR